MEEKGSGRVIKFRAWDGKQIVHDAALLRPDGDAELAAFDDGREVIWMQFSGLHDDSGTEIYEGDILPTELEINGVVEFDDGAFLVSCTDENSDGRSFHLSTLLENDSDARVLGNIYENPELSINLYEDLQRSSFLPSRGHDRHRSLG